jgi:hypothetical protein
VASRQNGRNAVQIGNPPSAVRGGSATRTGPPPVTLAILQEASALSEVLQYLTRHGERLDSEIAAETGMPLATVRQRVAGLAAAGEVITCPLTRFENGHRIDAWLCRVSGYIPPSAPGRKPKPKA